MKLKPCPWCGSEVKLRFDGVGNVGNGLPMTLCFQIRCPKCGALLVTSWPLFEVMRERLEDFEKSWNNTIWDAPPREEEDDSTKSSDTN